MSVTRISDQFEKTLFTPLMCDQVQSTSSEGVHANALSLTASVIDSCLKNV